MAKLKTGRKPVHLIKASKELSGRDAVWKAIRELKTFTKEDLSKKAKVNVETIRTFLTGLVKGGYISKEDHRKQNNNEPIKYNLVKDIGVDAPKVRKDGSKVKPVATENMWRTMRILKRFSVKDLILNATTDEIQIKPTSADSYCKYLCRAGYLAKNADRTYTFLQSKYTGPLAPMIQRIKQLYDPNIGKIVYKSGGKADD
ncbi:MAG: hypothetical protein AB7U85_04750 [Alphaproteobacteria bacterium]